MKVRRKEGVGLGVMGQEHITNNPQFTRAAWNEGAAHNPTNSPFLLTKQSEID